MGYHATGTGTFPLSSRSGPQGGPKVVELQDGRLLAVWSAYGGAGDGQGAGVYAQFLTAAGTRIGEAFRVNDSIQGDQQFPDVAVLKDGRFAITWDSNPDINNDININEIMAKVFAADGTAIGGEFRVNEGMEGRQSFPEIAALPQGGFTVSWSHGEIDPVQGWVNGYQIHSRLFNGNGQAMGGEYRVNDPTGYDAGAHSVDQLANGNLLHVFWAHKQYELNVPQGARTLYAEIENRHGDEVKRTFVLVAPEGNRDQLSPWVTTLAAGGFAVAFQQLLFEPVTGQAYTRLWVQTFTGDGSAIGSPKPIDRFDTAANVPHYFGGDIVGLDTGGFVMVTTAAVGPSLSSVISVRVFNDAGVVTEQFTYDTHGSPFDLNVEPISGGRFLVSWSGPSGVIFASDQAFLFGPNSDIVDFDTRNPADYGGANYFAGAGDDVVHLPSTATGMERWGLGTGFAGGPGNDEIHAGSTGVSLHGDAGNDKLYGSHEYDGLEGGDGDDFLRHSPGGEDNAADDLAGGDGLDTFVIGEGDHVRDAGFGERITLEGDLNGAGLVVIRDEDAGPGINVTLVSLDAAGTVIGSATLHLAMEDATLRIDRGDGTTSIVIGDRAGLPLVLTETFTETADRMITPHYDDLKASVRDLVVDKFQSAIPGMVTEKALDLLAKWGAARFASASFAGEFFTKLGIANRFVKGATVTEKVLVDAAEASIEFAAEAILFKLKDLFGIFADGAERTAAFEHDVQPAFDKVMNYFDVVDAAREVVAAGFGVMVEQAFKQLVDVLGLAGEPTSNIVLSEGGTAQGTDGDDVVLGAGESVVFVSSYGSNVYVDSSGRGVGHYGNAPGAVRGDLAAHEAHYGGNLNIQALGAAVTQPRADDLLYGIDTLIGSAFDDSLAGDSGANLLDGGGGADRLYGRAGDDSYIVDRQEDLVFENAGEGSDTVTASAGYYLFANIEKLVLSGSGDIFGVGNDLANQLTGNAGSNLLIAGGGDDLVHGGGGIDSLFGQDGVDQLFGDLGIDYLVGGIGNDVLDGGADADALYGEDGNDTLVGGSDFKTDILVGGAGNDVLRADSGLGDYDLIDGGAGNDTYHVDTGDDLTFETEDGGIDTVYANVAGANNGVYLYANVENLVLAGTTAFGVGNARSNTLTGSASANWLLGGANDDVLNGKAGNDVLFGEGGMDRFVFEPGTGGDVIGDFERGEDRIDLSRFFSSYDQVQAHMTEHAGTTAIDLGNGDLIVINGIAKAMLTWDNFIVAESALPIAPAMPVPVPPADHELDGVAGHLRTFEVPRLALRIDGDLTADLWI